jgi:ABC-2 type transport system permease protein
VTNVWVALMAMRAQAREMRGNPIPLILGIVQPVVFLVIIVEAAPVPPAEQGTDLVVGVALTALWASTIWSAGAILRADVHRGSLALAVTGVRSPAVVFLGRCTGAILRVSAAIAASTAVTAVVLGLPMRAGRPLVMLLGLVLVLMSATALGMLLSCLFLVTRHASAWSAALMYPVFIISGMIVPLRLIPAGLRYASLVISLRWAAEFLTAAADGRVSWSSLAALVGLTALYYVVALAAFHRLLQRARLTGTIDHG